MKLPKEKILTTFHKIPFGAEDVDVVAEVKLINEYKKGWNDCIKEVKKLNEKSNS